MRILRESVWLGCTQANEGLNANLCDYRHLRMTTQIQHIVPFERKRLCRYASHMALP